MGSMKTMRVIIFTLISLISLSCICEEPASKSVHRYQFNEADLILIPGNFYFVLLLNDYEDEKTFDRFEIVTKGEEVNFSFRARNESEDPYILVESRGGGTGLSTKELTVLTVVNKKFKKAGHFYLSYEENPRDYLRVHIEGEVKFNSDHEITYSWKKSGHNHEKNLAEKGAEIYEIKDGVFVRKGSNISTAACEGIWFGCDFLNCCPKP